MHPEFAHIRCWIFDLDNTLYPPTIRLFDQISARMVDFVMDFLKVDAETANQLRRDYWHNHGTTLAGLMDLHGLEPEQFLIDVHDIDFSVLPKDPDLAAGLKALPGRKMIYTNGTAPYAENVLAGRGLSGIFDEVYGVEHANYRPKPERAAFETVFGQANVPLDQAVMFEDEVRNLEIPKAMGVKTVYVAPTATDMAYVDHQTQDLTRFVSQCLDPGASGPI